uniref:NEDD4-binding protein 1 n=1 Tax=Petromyzon marinus TaxID=7757 RepID=A0AAJ7UEI6_PETMA|nr:NEDD4-binding protein 1 isoform X1 [Petromyzon marinus]
MANRDGGMRTAVQHGGGGSNRGSDGDYVEEFTVPASKEALVNNAEQNLQQIFFVCMTLVTTVGDNFSWVKLTGKSLENVQRAKEFVVGLCGEGLQVEQRFPPGLQCVYEGLAGRFLRALVWDSRADVSVTGEGRLTIRGGTEAVLLAQTRVQHFCDCCRETDAAGRGAAATTAPGEADSLAKRRFNRLVEEDGGKYGTELLLLPLIIKRDLLELLDAVGAHASFSRGPPDRTRGPFVLSARGAEATEAPGGSGGNRIRVRMPTEGQRTYGKGREGLSREENDSPVTELSSSFTSALGKAEAETPEAEESEECAGKPFERVKNPSVKRKTSDSESTVSGQMKKHSPANVPSSRRLSEEEGFRCRGREEATAAAPATPEPERELKYLVNFFSTMGYDPELVRSIVLEMGQQTEASEILDRLQEKATLVTPTADERAGSEEAGWEDSQEGSYATHWVVEAAMSLGYTRDEVGDVCRAVGTDPRSVLNELHRMGKRAAPTAAEPGAESARTEQRRERQGGPTGALTRVFSRGVCSHADRAAAQALRKKPAPEVSLSRSHGGEEAARGGPVNGAAGLPRGGSSSSSSLQRARLPSAEADDLETDGTGAPPPAASARPDKMNCIVISDNAKDVPHVCGPADGAAGKEAAKWHVEQPGPRQECAVSGSSSRVAAATTTTAAADTTTGSSSNLRPTELFLLGLSKPYKLYLPSEPGKEYVRHVIVDGSNVAMAHGLNRYFSCRGMALCVEYFWKRGHRNITVFVPQYRTRRDPSIKEQHLLTKLEELGLLSFTPCRMFEGRQIATHDDRFMLHLADNTDGIIVTNDNFREFTKESMAWREIVKKRILPYTFAGDVFMVPDDPLGRHGPRLDQFLTKPQSTRLMHHNPAAYQAKTFPLRLPSAAAATVADLPGSHSMNDCGRRWPSPPAEAPRPTNDLQDLRRQLLDIFPADEEKVQRVLQQYPAVKDLNLLSDLMLDV